MASPRAASGSWPAYPHQALAAVLQVRAGLLHVLLWLRSREPDADTWALPGGALAPAERLRESVGRHLLEQVRIDVVAHLEQLATHSAVERDPRGRVLATAYLALVPSGHDPALPDDSRWWPVATLPDLAFDHGFFVAAAVERLRAKLSYTNIGFALAPPTFTISELRQITSAALGYDVGATNLLRVLTRRGQIEPTDDHAVTGRGGGRPARRYRFVDRRLTVTDPFAVLRPPR